MIQLNALPFWIACGAGVSLLLPFRSVGLRKLVLAAVNLGFLVTLLRWQSVGLIVAIVTVYLCLQLVDRVRYRAVLTALLTGCFLALFVIHKLPQVANALHVDAVGRILALVGYSYVALRMVEVLRAVFERRHPAPDFASTVNYLLPFHMLAAGPIQAYEDFVQHANDSFEPNARDILIGTERIASGLFKKFVIAYLIQTMFLTNFEAGGLYRVLEIQVFFIWLFLDFSAYSDIAVGVGILMGVATPENFNRPLFARNVIDFWDRWHMSLSLFIRRNIFIPIQMFLMRRNGAPLISAAVAIAISFVLCGLWHGLTVGFLIWGAAQALGLIVTRIYGQVLQARLGKVAFKNYIANPWIRVAAVLVTFEFEACVLVALFKA